MAGGGGVRQRLAAAAHRSPCPAAGEHDIFGEELSDSDEEADHSFNRLDDPEDSAMSNSKFSAGDSNMSNTMVRR